MKSRLWFGCLCCGLLTAPVLLPLCLWIVPRGSEKGSPHTAGAALELDHWEHDFGVVLPGCKVNAVFEIQNSGSDDLLITNLEKSCGCTAPLLGCNRLPPGTATTLLVDLKIRARPGNIGHFVSFATNDPRHAQVRLPIRAKAQRPVDALPTDIYLGMLAPGREVARVVEVFSTDAAPLEGVRATASQPWVSVEELDGAAEHCRRFRVIVRTPQTAGAFDEIITFRAATRHEFSVVVGIRGEVCQAQRVSPPRVLLGARPPSTRAEARLVLHGPQQAHIRAVEARDGALQLIEWSQTPLNDRSILIRLTVAIPPQEGYHSGAILLDLDGSDPRIEVPVGCLVRCERETASDNAAGSAGAAANTPQVQFATMAESSDPR